MLNSRYDVVLEELNWINICFNIDKFIVVNNSIHVIHRARSYFIVPKSYLFFSSLYLSERQANHCANDSSRVTIFLLNNRGSITFVLS